MRIRIGRIIFFPFAILISHISHISNMNRYEMKEGGWRWPILKVVRRSRKRRWNRAAHTTLMVFKPHFARRPEVLLSYDMPVNNSPGVHTGRWRRGNRDTTATHKTDRPSSPDALFPIPSKYISAYCAPRKPELIQRRPDFCPSWKDAKIVVISIRIAECN